MADENILRTLTLNGKTFTVPEGGGSGGGDGNALYVNLTVDYSQGEHFPDYGLDTPVKDIVEHILNGGVAYIVNSVMSGDYPRPDYMPQTSLLIPVTSYGKNTMEQQGITADVYMLGATYTAPGGRGTMEWNITGMGIVSSGVTVQDEINADFREQGELVIGDVTNGAATTRLVVYDVKGEVTTYSRLRTSAQEALSLRHYRDTANNDILFGQVVLGMNDVKFFFFDGSGNGLKKITIVITDDGNDGLSYTLTETVIS